MLGALTDKMQDLFSKITGKSKLTEENIAEAVSEVRLALLEADVNYSVAKVLVKRLKEKSLGDAVLKSISPGQQFIKIVHDELIELMGGEEAPLDLKSKPAVVMMCGLQGSGKTTQCAKLANYLKKQKKCRQPLLAACDLQRPAAIEQLKTLGGKIGVPVFSIPNENSPVKVAKAALERARQEGFDLLILDTAGRLHIDDELMDQLQQIKQATKPHEILFVANAATGQDAVTVASEFNQKVEVTGTILTMLDSNTRGGAAISIREVTGKPLKFEGVGEKIDDIQPFNPNSMADRILGMGDTINLVRKAEEHIDEKEAKKLEEKIRKATFTYEDYLKQIQMVKKMGSFKSLLGMLPGMSKMKEMEIDDKEFFKVEAIIQSMTLNERICKCDLSIPRRKRIARGSGTAIDDINRLVKSFKKAKQFFKNMPNMKQLEKLMGGSQWR
ncbi:Signal recognition particle protein [Waddlia chondrophila 2032/99]|uniref:Signal recognition particle protein n=2 Tax=Waddlia chondrophila TaxID=71667 RepID=D6YVA3_WADCW|nr:signal recognition particle protein [Waddlia chondrophila]ADI38064.1 Signal recognition 54 kDa protein Ffh [Waddlia chondrophila WSU 86-1044]CCB91236.1 Signal recognition particle protein [Waddlia chondrophila 2032/99]